MVSVLLVWDVYDIFGDVGWVQMKLVPTVRYSFSSIGEIDPSEQ